VRFWECGSSWKKRGYGRAKTEFAGMLRIRRATSWERIAQDVSLVNIIMHGYYSNVRPEFDRRIDGSEAMRLVSAKEKATKSRLGRLTLQSSWYEF